MSISSIPNEVKHSTDRKKRDSLIDNLVADNVQDFKSGDLWRAAFAEFVGTCLLVFFGVGVGLSSDHQGPVPLLQVALGVGFTVAVIITALTTVSGGHINPAISMGFLVSNQITLLRFVVYMICQTTGAVTAVGLLKAIMPESYHGNLGLLVPAKEVTDGSAFVMEMIISGTLIFVTLAMVDKYRTDVGGSVPLMVGLTVCVNILGAGNVTGGCMNPARASGSAFIVGNVKKLWIYWIAPLTGAAIASWVYDNIFSTRPLPIILRCIRMDNQERNMKKEEAEMHLQGIDDQSPSSDGQETIAINS